MRRNRLTATFASLTLAASLLAGSSHAAETASATLRQHVAGNGAWYALALQDSEPAARSEQRYLLLVDTSASQVGYVREAGLKIVQDLVHELPQSAQVQLVAMDTGCLSLTDGYVTPVSSKFAHAVQRLKKTTPLGATNLRTALRFVLEQSDHRPTSVLWIGDGLSAVHALTTQEISALTSQLVTSRVTVHSILMGAQTNPDLPSALANLTGGVVYHPSLAPIPTSDIALGIQRRGVKIDSVQVNGRPLYSANSSAWLRSDRHCILLGQENLADARTVTVTLSDGRVLEDTPLVQETAGAELRHLYDLTRTSEGLVTPVASLAMLDRASADLDQLLEASTRIASRLHRMGRDSESRRVARQATELDAADSRVEAMLTALTASQNADDTAPGDTRRSGALSEVEARIRVRTQRLQQVTATTIEEARSYSADQPEYSETLLKDLLETIRAATDISRDAQEEMERRVVSAIGAVQNRQDQLEATRQANAVRRAVEEAHQNRLAQQADLEANLQTIIDRVRGLLERAREGDIDAYEDAEAVSRVAIELKPGLGASTGALMASEAAGQLDKARRLRELRADRFLETLYQVELSHVPFPDEPPVQYPPTDVWRALSLTRKAKYSAFSLQSESKVEAWLTRMLDEPVPLLEYPGEASLREILDYLADHYTTTWGSVGGGSGNDFRMTIWPDTEELKVEGIDSLDDVRVTGIELEGMSLRTALKLIFERTSDPKLTYVIQDDVMKITTWDKANSNEALDTRIYPVGDLVIPPDPPEGGGGGGFGGGGGGGGFGGGGGGFGGNGGGGGFGGAGGGAFSIPPEWQAVLEQADKGISADQLKKKP